MFNNAAAFLESYGKLSEDDAVQKLAKILSELNMDLLNDENTAADFISAQKVIILKNTSSV